MKITLSFLLILLLLEPVSSEEVKSRITINILSKHTRQIEEGSLKYLSFRFPDGSLLFNEITGEKSPVNRAELRHVRGKWILAGDTVTLEEPFTIQVKHDSSETLQVSFTGEVRNYPLPLLISSQDNSIIITVTETIQNYAVDSAWAEYGGKNADKREALAALAHIIRARSLERLHNPVHSGYHFCDLTHCQVYTGKTCRPVVLDREWQIDWKVIQKSLFFHSRCGGHTTGTCVFNGSNTGFSGVNDILYRFGLTLCGEYRWQRSMSLSELAEIIYSERHKKIYSLRRERCRVRLETGNGMLNIAPETFRLRINRVRGWNFIKSNNYTITEKQVNRRQEYIFSGKGLGHGVGFCQHGALELSRRGYNRFDILHHYFPNIKFILINEKVRTTPNLSWCIFDIKSGDVVESFSSDLTQRFLPPGSLFKLFVAVYLANRRQDIFNSYTYTCRGFEKNIPGIAHCWYRKGHGKFSLSEALPHSCNLYFGSLYDQIDYRDFKSFMDDFLKKQHISMTLPDTVNSEEWASMLSGLDFSLNISVKELITLTRALALNDLVPDDADSSTVLVPWYYWNSIINSLKRTIQTGTVSGKVKKYGLPENYMPLQEKLYPKIDEREFHDFWGKTSTVIDGTNQPIGYGIFLGVKDDIGVITILRKGNGHLAGKWAMVLLHEYTKAH